VFELYSPWHNFAVTQYSVLESVRETAVPPVPPCVKVFPEVSVTATESRRDPPRKVSTEALGEAGREGRSLNQVP
jgi:hypothetical protein